MAKYIASHGRANLVSSCVALLSGANWREHTDAIHALGGNERWPSRPDLSYWVRVWAARGLLHVWDDSAADALRRALQDKHWRVVEMSLKVCRAHNVLRTASASVAAANHEEPRVRIAAGRALAVVGDVEHIDVLEMLCHDATPAVSIAAKKATQEMRVRLDHYAR